MVQKIICGIYTINKSNQKKNNLGGGAVIIIWQHSPQNRTTSKAAHRWDQSQLRWSLISIWACALDRNYLSLCRSQARFYHHRRVPGGGRTVPTPHPYNFWTGDTVLNSNISNVYGALFTNASC